MKGVGVRAGLTDPDVPPNKPRDGGTGSSQETEKPKPLQEGADLRSQARLPPRLSASQSSCPGLAWDGWAVGGCRQAHLETAPSGVDGKTSYRTAPTPETPRATFSAARGSRASEDY